MYGNNCERESLELAAAELGMTFADPPLELAWAGRRIVVVHDPKHLEPELLSRCDVALHGHDHRHVAESRSGALVFNPGECAGHLPGHNAIGVLDLATLEAERLFF